MSGGETIGIVGVGLVGSAIAEHLLGRGYGVVGHDIDGARNAHLEGIGGSAVDGAAAVGRRARRVFLSLMTTEAVRQVTDSLLAADPPPTNIIDTTTGAPAETAALAGRLAERGIAFLDATISGSSQQIRDRRGVFMVGGTTEAFDACSDLLHALSDEVVHVGPSGSGSKAKLASNLILGLNRLALAEGLVFAEALGLDPAAFLDLLKTTPAYSVAMDVKGEKMLSADFAPQSRLSQHHKDVSIILSHAAAVGQELPLSRVHLEIMEKLMEAGDGDLDSCVVIREIRRRRD